MKTSPVKITKGQIDEVLASGVRLAKFRNKGVQKRLLKNQEKVKREQERRENHTRQLNKHREMMDKQYEERKKREAEGEQLRQQAEASVNAPEVTPEHIVANVKMTAADMALDSNGRPPFHNIGNYVREDGLLVHCYTSRPEGDKISDSALLNLYGDKDNYKPIPEIGDIIREDGLLLALHKGPATLTTEAGRVNDTVLYSVPGTVVTEPMLSTVNKFCNDRKVSEAENFVSSTEPTDISSKIAAVANGGEERESGLNAHRPDHVFDPLLSDLNPFDHGLSDGRRVDMYRGYNGTPPDFDKIAKESLPERVWVVGEKGENKDDEAAPDNSYSLPA